MTKYKIFLEFDEEVFFFLYEEKDAHLHEPFHGGPGCLEECSFPFVSEDWYLPDTLPSEDLKSEMGLDLVYTDFRNFIDKQWDLAWYGQEEVETALMEALKEKMPELIEIEELMEGMEEGLS